MEKQKKDKKKNIYPYIIALVFFFFGYFLAKAELITIPGRATAIPQDVFFKKVERILSEKYPFKEPSIKEKLYGSIQGLVQSYNDDFTTFLTPVYSRMLNEDVKGEFGGIGAEMAMQNGMLVVISPLKNSPAERSGIKAGDIILKVDGKDIAGKTLLDVLNEIRGEKGTTVNLTVYRNEDETIHDVQIERDIIKIPTLETKTISNTFIISLHSFNEDAANLLKNAIAEFEQSGKENLIIDLRGNPGGYFDEAIDLLSYFIEGGKVLVREDFGDNGGMDNVKSRGYSLKNKPKHIAVIIDRGSASASEIVAGAMKDYGKAFIMGERSYGKGSMQELIPFDNGTSLKITVARWLTPKGEQISKKGINPDFLVEGISEMSLEEIAQLFQKLINRNEVKEKEL